jgi:hypothetical protein
VNKSKWAAYFWKIIWIIGFIILLEISIDFKSQVQENSKMTYNIIPVLWANSISSFIFGLYASIIIVKKWTFKFNLPLLVCVCIPCIFIAFGYPIIATISYFEYLPDVIAGLPISFWLIKIFSEDVVGIIAGVTLVLSIFNFGSAKK